MSAVAKLAWRNLWRQGRRTALLLIVVAYATLAIIFFWGFTDGFLASILHAQARLVSAPVLVTTEAYHNDPDPENALPSLDVAEALEGFPGVEGLAPRLLFPALLRSPYATRGAQVRGVDPSRASQTSALPGHISEGRMLHGRGEVVLGSELAAELDVRLGERLAMDVQSLAGPRAAGFEVVGFIESGVVSVDDSVVLVHIADARELTGVDGATGLALDVPRGREAAVAASLNASDLLPAGLRAYEVKELMGVIADGLAAERASMIPIGLIFSIFGAVTVMSTVIVSVLERTREFGVITALGLDQNRLAQMVTLEATFTTVLGFIIGAVLGYALTFTLGTWNVLGPPLSAAFGQFQQLPFTDEIYTATSPTYLLYAAITIVLAALFAALVPARRVRRLNPAEAMRAN